jgi:hypothetical protein
MLQEWQMFVVIELLKCESVCLYYSNPSWETPSSYRRLGPKLIQVLMYGNGLNNFLDPKVLGSLTWTLHLATA